jgi:hypothetical protein
LEGAMHPQHLLIEVYVILACEAQEVSLPQTGAYGHDVEAALRVP